MKKWILLFASFTIITAAAAPLILNVRDINRAPDIRQTAYLDQIFWFAGESVRYSISARRDGQAVFIPPDAIPLWTVASRDQATYWLQITGAVEDPARGRVAFSLSPEQSALPVGDDYLSMVSVYTADMEYIGVLDRTTLRIDWMPDANYSPISPLPNPHPTWDDFFHAMESVSNQFSTVWNEVYGFEDNFVFTTWEDEWNDHNGKKVWNAYDASGRTMIKKLRKKVRNVRENPRYLVQNNYSIAYNPTNTEPWKLYWTYLAPPTKWTHPITGNSGIAYPPSVAFTPYFVDAPPWDYPDTRAAILFGTPEQDNGIIGLINDPPNGYYGLVRGEYNEETGLIDNMRVIDFDTLL
jgi:hypothetical protein